MEVFIRFCQFLNVYRHSHKKKNNFLNISMFSNSHSVVVHNCLRKSTFPTKFKSFLPKIDIFAQKLMLRKTLVTLLQSLHDMILSLYLTIHAFGQKLTLFA